MPRRFKARRTSCFIIKMLLYLLRARPRSSYAKKQRCVKATKHFCLDAFRRLASTAFVSCLKLNHFNAVAWQASLRHREAEHPGKELGLTVRPVGYPEDPRLDRPRSREALGLRLCQGQGPADYPHRHLAVALLAGVLFVLYLPASPGRCGRQPALRARSVPGATTPLARQLCRPA